ncbi:YwpF family protein [Virgibacillus halodenitrificans]|uniref:YwpF-like protein n=1 Tax=Virgibacillus halodenitrificans TaxID=1482 RepID=A0AAC9NLB7_VIRHA|nr:YwpF family protein [Virgibacillus halodenitrificans]APC48805.1 hypothetical protein BME96_11655 [Virgibacillus halodenitrificans]MBD1224379.1 hypothetical protein [Virgibacillus halodenitrificans]MCG1029435.1 hypothetical protein [Virgibacillus halodenitrificans]MCJ0931389.1 YwpF-like family protein [Virgibacillus halodenitrificans]MEC2158443.1 YwpF family protein [Virgibacillus halodenitrificans]
MKTFKLKSLEILEQEGEEIKKHSIELKDGLIINREDERNQWTIEAYVDHSYLSLFNRMKEIRDEIMIQVKITKESNDYATFITSIVSINEIGSDMNVLFLGTIIDRQKSKIEEMLVKLVEQGYEGKNLIKKFKELT